MAESWAPDLKRFMAADELACVPVTLNGHRFGWVTPTRASQLVEMEIATQGRAGQVLRVDLQDVTKELHDIHKVLAHRGLLQGWRSEFVDVLDWSGALCLGQMERAAARFWGSHTRAVHLNAWVRCDDGHGLRLWLARRAASKSTDPGLWDNLVAGGLGPQESPLIGLRREAQEEASLDLASALQVRCGPTLKIERPVTEGWQHESLFVVDAQLPMDYSPVNRDGEVQAFEQVDSPTALRWALSRQMTADAAMVTLDFLRRFHI